MHSFDESATLRRSLVSTQVATEYKQMGKRFHLRFLRQEDHRQLAKGRDLLRDVESWRVAKVR